MRGFLIAAMATAACAVSVGAHAADDRASNKNDDDRVVCRRGEPATGSRLGATRVCRTRGEWREIEAHAQREMQEFRRGSGALKHEAPGAGGPN